MNDPEPTTAGEVDSVASMEAILECVAQPVWVVDHDGMVVFVNPAGLAALGYDDLSELRGRFGHDAIHYKHRDGSPYPAEDCPMTKVRGTGATITIEEDWFVRRDGSMFPVSYTSTPIDMPDGPGAVVAFKDVEEQREAEQALREREAILAKVGQPVWVTDAAGRFHYANPAALAALGFEELSPTSWASPLIRPCITSTPTGRRSPRRIARWSAPARRGRRCRTPRTGSCARTARSCASPTRRRPSSCPTASAR
jgi:PAS domain S-box-containing protein